jgi:hypothetical protein
MPTVREFVQDCYNLVNAHNPTIPLQGSDLLDGIRYLNDLIAYYASTGLNITIAKTVSVPVIAGQQEVVIGPPTAIPLPDITEGRLANHNKSWLTLSGVTYPLIYESRPEFLASWKYEPLQGLPRFVIPFPDTDVVRLRLYPAPSQGFTYFLRGKFQLPSYTANDTMNNLPAYYMRFFKLAVGKDIAFYKGRIEAWTQKLENELINAQNVIEAASEIDVSITGDEQSLLNGAWRVRSGI